MQPITLVVLFIVVAILLAVTTIVVGSVNDSDRCKTLPGFVATGGDTSPFSTQADLKTSGVSDSTANGTYFFNTWAHQCHTMAQTQQDAFSVLVVIVVVIAAAAILAAIRWIG